VGDLRHQQAVAIPKWTHLIGKVPGDEDIGVDVVVESVKVFFIFVSSDRPKIAQKNALSGLWEEIGSSTECVKRS
jgi:hypothetical protein